jgi:hypothetical protein
VELYLHFPNTPSWRGAQLKHRDDFTFYLTNGIYDKISILKLQYIPFISHIGRMGSDRLPPNINKKST